MFGKKKKVKKSKKYNYSDLSADNFYLSKSGEVRCMLDGDLKRPPNPINYYCRDAYEVDVREYNSRKKLRDNYQKYHDKKGK